jgi:uncharacterized membrane protein YagU involved in acid resistance
MRADTGIWGAIFGGGLVAGACDFVYANIFYYAWRELPPEVLWQSVASGALGSAAFDGGYASAALGVGFHFLIACLMAAAFVVVSRYARILLRHAVVFGLLYGVCLYYIMNGVVLPLSNVPTSPDMSRFPVVGTSTVNFIGGLLIHMLGVGLPIALVARRKLSRRWT